MCLAPQVKWKLLSCVRSLWPHALYHPWNSPAESQRKPKNTGVGSLSLLQLIFLTQELNLDLLHCRWIPYQLCGSTGKESACNAGDLGSIPRLGRSPGEGNGNPFQYSCLENSMDRGVWWARVHGSQRDGHDWVTNTCTQLATQTITQKHKHSAYYRFSTKFPFSSLSTEQKWNVTKRKQQW